MVQVPTIRSESENTNVCLSRGSAPPVACCRLSVSSVVIPSVISSHAQSLGVELVYEKGGAGSPEVVKPWLLGSGVEVGGHECANDAHRDVCVRGCPNRQSRHRTLCSLLTSTAENHRTHGCECGLKAHDRLRLVDPAERRRRWGYRVARHLARPPHCSTPRLLDWEGTGNQPREGYADNRARGAHLAGAIVDGRDDNGTKSFLLRSLEGWNPTSLCPARRACDPQ